MTWPDGWYVSYDYDYDFLTRRIGFDFVTLPTKVRDKASEAPELRCQLRYLLAGRLNPAKACRGALRGHASQSVVFDCETYLI